MDRILQELVALLPLLLLGGVLYFSALTLVTLWLMTHPPRRTYSWAVARGIPGDPSELDSPREFTETTVRVGKHAVSVWEIPGETPSGPVIFLSPGWGDSKLGSVHRLGAMLPHCSRLIAIDSLGLGESAGWCTLGAREPRMLEGLVRQLADGSPVVLTGWSLGAGVSIATAARLASDPEFAPVAVIAEAPYRQVLTPASAVMAMQRLPWRVNLRGALWLLGACTGQGPGWRGFDRAGLASELRCPVLVLHGSDDPISPIEDGREIAKAAGEATLVETQGGAHNDLWVDPEFRPAQIEAVDAFLRRVLA